MFHLYRSIAFHCLICVLIFLVKKCMLVALAETNPYDVTIFFQAFFIIVLYGLLIATNDLPSTNISL